jgi:hypothetical protein
MNRKTAAAVASSVLASTLLVAAPAHADTTWSCVTWDSLLYNKAGICGELVYSRVDKGDHCQVRGDRILVYGVGGNEEFNEDPAIRVYSLDLQNAKGHFLFNRDDVAIKNKKPNHEKQWDPKGTWKSSKLILTVDYKVYLKGARPDKEGVFWFTVGPFNKNCEVIDDNKASVGSSSKTGTLTTRQEDNS